MIDVDKRTYELLLSIVAHTMESSFLYGGCDICRESIKGKDNIIHLETCPFSRYKQLSPTARLTIEKEITAIRRRWDVENDFE